jgi:hypothetical protein
MSKVYRIGSMYGTEYVNTAKEANRCKPGGEEPESVERLDAAEECARLAKDVEDAERSINAVQMLLEDLCGVCPPDVLESTEAGKRASKFIKAHPLPPAGDGNRDGQRSYAG